MYIREYITMLNTLGSWGGMMLYASTGRSPSSTTVPVRVDLERGAPPSYQDYERDTYRTNGVGGTHPKWSGPVGSAVYPRWQVQQHDQQRQEWIQFGLQAFDLVVLTVFASLVDSVLKAALPDFSIWTLVCLASLFLVVALAIRRILFVQRHHQQQLHSLHGHQN